MAQLDRIEHIAHLNSEKGCHGAVSFLESFERFRTRLKCVTWLKANLVPFQASVSNRNCWDLSEVGDRTQENCLTYLEIARQLKPVRLAPRQVKRDMRALASGPYLVSIIRPNRD